MQIEIKTLHKAVFPGSRCQRHALIREEASLLLREDTSAFSRRRHDTLVEPQENQHLDVFETGSLHVAHQHLVQRGRNQAHAAVLETGLQKLLIVLQAHDLVAQKLYQLVKETDDRPVDLVIDLGLVHLSLFLKVLFHLSELLLELFPGDETVEPFGPLAHCDIFSPHGFRVSRCLLKESLPERIKPRQILGRKASGLLSPLLFPHGISPDSRRQHIIFHIIDGLRCKIQQAAAKEAENRLIAVIADQHFQRRLHKFQERI